MLRTTLEMLNDVEELFDAFMKEHVLKHTIQSSPNTSIDSLIDSINQEFDRLHMPYFIKDLAYRINDIWIVEDNLFPTKLNWKEPLYFNERGEAVYQKLLTPFKEAHVYFPNTLQSAMELFKVDFGDSWNLSFYRDWLIGINTTFYPHECKAIMQKLMALTVKV